MNQTASKDFSSLMLGQFLFFIFIFSRVIFAANHEGTLSTELYRPPVAKEVLAAWLMAPEGPEEIWYLTQPQKFFEQLREILQNPKLLTEILRRYRTGDGITGLTSFVEYDPSRSALGVVSLPKEITQQLGSSQLQKIYELLLLQNGAPPHIGFPSIEIFRAYMKALHVDEESFGRVLQRTYLIGDHHYFFFTPESYELLPPMTRYIFLQEKVDTRWNEAIRVYLTISPADDLDAIARHYAGLRNPERVARYLRKRLSQGSGAPVRLPLENILHPFIRKRIYTYPVCSGPNCYQTALLAGTANPPGPLDPLILMGEDADFVLEEFYRPLGQSERPQPYDILVYRGEDGLEHMSSYITNKIVYVKGSYFRTTPSVFRRRAVDEQTHFVDGRSFQLSIFRACAYSADLKP